MGRSIGEQISGMLAPSLNIVEDEFTSNNAQARPVVPLLDATPKRKGQRRAKSASTAAESNTTQAIEFRNDPSKYATPRQQWNTAEKAIWLLYVVKELAQVGELSTGQIVKTFNTQFRQAKTVTHSNVSRDLGRLKISSPSLVGEDVTKSPATWFLTEEGVRKTQTLIAEARVPTAA